jgi:hypothetical protein
MSYGRRKRRKEKEEGRRREEEGRRKGRGGDQLDVYQTMFVVVLTLARAALCFLPCIVLLG